MKILYASERPPYPFFLGGAARSAHYLLSTLVRDYEVDATAVGSAGFGGRQWTVADIADRDLLTASAPVQDGAMVTVHGPYPVRLVGDFFEQLPAVIESEAPDVVWTQLDGFDRVALVARSLGRDAIVYLRDAEDTPTALRNVVDAGCALVCNSEFMARRVLSLTRCRAAVIYPSLESQFGVHGDPDGFITMINPYRVKGVDTFLAVAREMPDKRFLLVESWLLEPAGLAALRQRLADLPNVTFMHRVADVSEVYARTRLLLVPSIWEEAFGRVVIEAQSCGIPVVASHRGGLPESVGDGGLCVADYASAPAWIAAIRPILDDLGRYRELASRAFAHADSERFTTRYAAQRLLEICSDRALFRAPARKGIAGWLDRARGIRAGART